MNFPPHIPSRWVICSECDGDGKTSAHMGDFTAAELSEDPEFARDYFAGRYDCLCQACKGSGKVREAVVGSCSFQQKRQLAAIRRDQKRDVEYAAERAAECRMRERGIQF